jgi:hypothetical protein
MVGDMREGRWRGRVERSGKVGGARGEGLVTAALLFLLCSCSCCTFILAALLFLPHSCSCCTLVTAILLLPLRFSLPFAGQEVTLDDTLELISAVDCTGDMKLDFGEFVYAVCGDHDQSTSKKVGVQ